MNIAIYGGSFDPPHIGHLNVVLHALNNWKHEFDELHIIPCYQQSGKNLSKFPLRVELCRAMFGDLPNVWINEIERDIYKGWDSYTYDTVMALQERDPRIEKVIMICGSDVGEAIPNWDFGEELLELVELRIAPRSPYSSTEIRNYFKSGGIYSDMTTHSVNEGIKLMGLYI